MTTANQKLSKLGKRLFDLKAQKSVLTDDLKELNKELSHLETKEIPSVMEDAEIEKFSIEGYGTIFLGQVAYAHIAVNNRDKAMSWLLANGHHDIVKQTIHPQTLRAFIKEQFATGSSVPDFFNAKIYPIAKTRRTS